MKHLLAIREMSASQLEQLVELGAKLKADRGNCDYQPLARQNWGMIFMKSSTRTRVSFEVGIRELGGNPMFFSNRDLQLGRGEPVKDTARVLGRMLNGAIIRTFGQDEIEQFAEFSGIPTINALTDEEHPCQILADLLTIVEKLGTWEGKRICFIGDGDCNMARSWMWAAERLNFTLVVAAPDAFLPPQDYRANFKSGRVEFTEDPHQGATDCDAIYTDVWVSMGKEEESQERLEILAPYQVNDALMAKAKKEAIVLHCLPAYREKEITEAVLEQHADTIFDQAENRLHAQKAVLCELVENKF